MMETQTTADLASFPAIGTPVAPNTGPFPFRAFLETAWSHHHAGRGDLVTVSTDAGDAIALAVTDERISFVGPEDLTDYHSPLGSDTANVVAAALDGRQGSAFRFDSLPAEAATVMSTALDHVGADYSTDEHAATAVLQLPPSFDDWLMSIGKKERHEVRRKRRKFEATYGEARLESAGIEQLAAFAEMHRCQPGDKGSFMTEPMEGFFADLVTNAGGVIHALVCEDRILAAAFGFETEDGYYYYNSAFEPDAAAASPGVVLLSLLVENQIDRGAGVFDFLKGEETYKYRHGAVRRPLYVLEGVLR